MKFSRVIAAVAMTSISAPLFAAAEQAVGTVTAASTGTFVSHNGKIAPAHAGQSLFVGDRVITRGASAKVSMQGCKVALAPTSMLSVGKSSCAAPKSFAATQDPTNSTGAGVAATTTATTTVTTTAIVVGVVAAAAVAGGIAAGTSNTSATSVSP
jgi:hypothetical protein